MTTTEQHAHSASPPFWDLANAETREVPEKLRPRGGRVRDAVSQRMWWSVPNLSPSRVLDDAGHDVVVIGKIAEHIYWEFIEPSLGAPSFEDYWRDSLKIWWPAFTDLFDSIIRAGISPVHLIDMLADETARKTIPSMQSPFTSDAIAGVESAAKALRDSVSLVLAHRTLPKSADYAPDFLNGEEFSIGVRRILIALMTMNALQFPLITSSETVMGVLRMLQEGAATSHRAAWRAFSARLPSDVRTFAEENRLQGHLETTIILAGSAFDRIRISSVSLEESAITDRKYICIMTEVLDRIDLAVGNYQQFILSWITKVPSSAREQVRLMYCAVEDGYGSA